MLDRPGVLLEENHRETTEAWLAAFDAALANRSAAELSQLFVADSHWRNLATGYKGPDHLLTQLFGADVAKRVGRVWGFDHATAELRNMWTRTPQAGLWFVGGAFSQARIYSRYIAAQIDAIEVGRLGKQVG